MDFDPVLLARLQFAFTIVFHIIFPSFTIGLSAYLATLGALWLRTGNDRYQQLMRFWTRIFAVSFAMGVVSGIVLSYQFGTNWSRFSLVVGNIVGPLIGYEVLSAFFLEATFLGVLLFGFNRVPPWLYVLSAAIVAVGTAISAFWILSANSWMQTPTGHQMIGRHRATRQTGWPSSSIRVFRTASRICSMPRISQQVSSCSRLAHAISLQAATSKRGGRCSGWQSDLPQSWLRCSCSSAINTDLTRCNISRSKSQPWKRIGTEASQVISISLPGRTKWLE